MPGFSFADYVAYFEKIATEHKDILHTPAQKHFFRMNLNEIVGHRKAGLFFPAMILERVEGGFIDNNSDNILKARTGAFSIIKHCAKDDFKREHEIYDECEEIMEQIIARIQRDDRECLDIPVQINLNTVEFQQIGPVQENAFGTRCEFTFLTRSNILYNAAKWL